ncbi:MAG: PAS domain-containing protein [Dechloromonas sp.]|nr:PAS domain-containing protein [Dechloromonas sp.]
MESNLRTHYRAILGEQQLSTASYLANEIEQELQGRLRALTRIARMISPAMVLDSRLAQDALDKRVLLNDLFEGGTLLIRADGVAVAEAGVKAQRVGVNYLDIETVAMALHEGKANVGQPLIGKKLAVPVIGISAPVLDERGRVVGALVGIINLSGSNFFDGILNTKYVPGKGYSLLVSPQKRLIVTSSDQSRTMEKLPPVGVNPAIDRFIDGAEGIDILRSPRGVEVLAAVKRIPVAGWYVATLLPTAEAYAPITLVTRNMYLAAVIFSLLAGSLVWWSLRRQLQVLKASAEAMEAMADSRQPLQRLPDARQDEIGQVLRSFNYLLESLSERDQAKAALLESLNDAQRLTQIGSWNWDPRTDRVSWSDEMYRIFGRDPALPPLDFSAVRQVFTPESWTKVAAAIKKTIKECTPYECDAEIVLPDGRHRWIRSRGNIECDAAGKAVRLWGTSQEITERLHAAKALARVRDMLDEAEKIAHLGSFEYLVESQTTVWSEEEYRIYGLDPSKPSPTYDELLEKNIYPDDATRLHETFIRAMEGKGIYELEHRIVQPDGTVRWVYDRANPYFDETGRLVRYVGATLDITERKAAEIELKTRNDELERFNRAMIGRELEMLEMKKQINALSRALGRPAPFLLSFLDEAR